MHKLVIVKIIQLIAGRDLRSPKPHKSSASSTGHNWARKMLLVCPPQTEALHQVVLCPTWTLTTYPGISKQVLMFKLLGKLPESGS